MAKDKYILPPNLNSLETICKLQFQNKQKDTELGNRMWRLKCEKLKNSQEFARLERRKDDIFLNMGMKQTKDIRKEEKVEKND